MLFNIQFFVKPLVSIMNRIQVSSSHSTTLPNVQFFEKPNRAIKNSLDTPSSHSTTLANVQFFEKPNWAIRNRDRDTCNTFYNTAQRSVL